MKIEENTERYIVRPQINGGPYWEVWDNSQQKVLNTGTKKDCIDFAYIRELSEKRKY